MKKFLFIVLVFVFPLVVSAHPGRLASDNCHYCYTNCESWGLVEGERHCHNGDTYSNSKGQIYNNDGVLIQDVVIDDDSVIEENEYIPPVVNTKSSDNSLKRVIVDDISIDLNNLVFETVNDEVDIEVDTNDSNATYKIVMNDLIIGENDISIIVTAEDGSTKTYRLVVNKIDTASDDFNFVLEIDGDLIEFDDFESSISVLSSVNELDYDYELSHQDATLEVTGADDLSEGENTVLFKVSIDDVEQIYTLIVTKDSEGDFFVGLLSLGILGGIGYLIYKVIRRYK